MFHFCNRHTAVSVSEAKPLGGRFRSETALNLYNYCVYIYIYYIYISGFDSSWTPGVFYTYFYNHAHHLRLEKLLYLELSRSPNGFFKSTSDPGGSFTSETAARRFQK
jgi:hypothetical protein